MKLRCEALLLSVLLGPLLAGPAAGQSGDDSQAVIALHVQEHVSKYLDCANLDPALPCSGFNGSWPVGVPADVYLVVARADPGLGIKRVSFALQYTSNTGAAADGAGIDILSYRTCGDYLSYYQYPAPGGGAILGWSRSCQRTERGTDGVHAVVAEFYVYAYSPDVLEIVANPGDYHDPGGLYVEDCAGTRWPVSHPARTGAIGFGIQGYNPCGGSGGDLIPPYLGGVAGSDGSTVVTAVFNEPVGSGADNAANYRLSPKDVPSAALGVVSAEVNGSYVTLTLAHPLSGATSYTLRVSNIRDLAGNSIYPNSSRTFPVAGPDTTPPVLLTASGTAGSNHVTLVFDEVVVFGAVDAWNYHVYPAGDPGSPIAVTLATRSYGVVTLTLASNLAGSTTYTAAASSITDLAGNMLAPGAAADFTTGPVAPGDITPPELVGASGEAAGTSVILTFSEAMGSGSNVVANYSLYPSADPGSPLALNQALLSGAQVTLKLGSSLAASTAYTASVSNVQDPAGNAIAPGSTAGFTTGVGDTVAPVLIGAVGAAGSDLVTVRFSEPVAGGATTITNYSVVPTGDPTAALGLKGAAVASSQVTLRLNATLAGATSYTVAVSNLSDAAGNTIAAGSTTEFTTEIAGGGPGDQSRAVVALHVQAHDTKAFSCASMDPNLSCDRFVREWPIRSPADVFMVICMADPVFGVSGVSLGVDYANPGTLADGVGVDVHGYTSCADLQYPNSPDGNPAHEFPYSGGGNRLIWSRTDNCQRRTVDPWGVQVVACAFYVYAYSPDQFRVDMNRNLETDPEFQIVDCPGPSLSDMPYPDHAGTVGFGPGRSGYSPCTAMVPTVRTTWGRLKNQYQ